MKTPGLPSIPAAAILALLACTPAIHAHSPRDPDDGAEYGPSELTDVILAHPRDPDGWRQLGAYYAREGQEEVAIADFTKAIKLDPNFTVAYIDRADCYLGNNEWRKAIPDYTAVIRLDPQNENAYASRAQCYYYINRGDALDRAVADYTEAIRLSPHDADLYNSRADCYSEMGDAGSSEKAIADYTQIIALTSDKRQLWHAYQSRGVTNLTAGHYEAAIADFSKLLESSPADNDSRMNRGDAYAHMGDFEKAIADYTGSGNTQAPFIDHWRLAHLYKIMGQPDKAQAEQDILLKSRQDSIKTAMNGSLAYYNLGERYEARGDYPHALAAFKHGMRTDRRDWVGYQELGELYTKMGDAKKAMPCLDKAVDLATIADGDDDPIQLEQALYSRAESSATLGDYAQAIADYRTLIGFYPHYPGPYAPLARIYASCPYKKFRDGPKSVTLAQKGCTLSAWRDTEQIETLAAAEAEAGNFDEAVKWQQRAIELANAEKGDLKKDEAAMKTMSTRLTLYQSHKPYRQEKKPRSQTP